MNTPKRPDSMMTDAIEAALWQDLADALTRLEEYGITPLPDLNEIDAGPVIHGGGTRKDGFRLRRTDSTEDPAYCWTVSRRVG